MVKRPSTTTLKPYASDYARLLEVLLALARDMPDKTTIRQAAAFAMVAYGESVGRSLTITDLQELSGNRPDGTPVIGRAIERTLDIFREPTKHNERALSWVATEEDPDDRRRKYLHLTPGGALAARTFRDALFGRLHTIPAEAH